MSLIRTIEQFRAHVGVNANSDLENLRPDLLLVETERLQPLLGEAFFAQLQGIGDAELEALLLPTSTDLLSKVVREAQCAAANLASLEYLDMNQVQFSDVGVHIFSDGQKKTAFQWQINNLKRGFAKKGFNALERLLSYLDAHIDAPELAAWASSPAATASHQFFLNTAAQFSEHYNIGASRLTYLALLPTLKKVERFQLAPVLGPDFYFELKEQVLDRDLSADNRRLLDEYLRPALAHLVVAKAVPELGLAFNGDAVELNIYRFDDANNKEADAGIEQLLTLKVDQASKDGQVFLSQLRQYLNAQASPTRFATYYHSANYQAPGAPRPVVRNEAANSTYRFC